MMRGLPVSFQARLREVSGLRQKHAAFLESNMCVAFHWSATVRGGSAHHSQNLDASEYRAFLCPLLIVIKAIPVHSVGIGLQYNYVVLV